MTPAGDIVIRPATSDDALTLAALHGALLPGSRLSLFGPGYLASCYRYFIGSPEELVLVARCGESVVGGALLTIAPRSLSLRLATVTPLLLQFLLKPFGRGVRQIIADMLHPEWPTASLPELVAIFVMPDQQGRGIGELICLAIEAELARRQIECYVVHTERDPNNRAIAFYERLGFAATEPPNSRYRLMRLSKPIP